MSEILGVLFAVLVGIMVIPKYTQYQTASNNNVRAAITAQQQTQINSAATTYIKQNSVAIQAAATATSPVVLTVPMLQTAGLPATFSAINPYGQTWQVEVLQPTAGNLQALSMSTGGTAVPDAQASKIASLVGATGGLIPQNDSGIFPGGSANAYGTYSGWTVSTANYTSVAGGHPASLLTFNNGQFVSNYLYRNAVPGQPQLNTMTTPLVMASVQTNGGACSTTGAIAQDGTGVPLSCQAGVWTAPGGGKCVSTVADLNTIETDGRCYNGNGNPNSPAGGDWFFMEVYRHINTANYYAVQRVMGMTGAAVGKVWQRNQLSATPGAGWTAWVQQADPGVSVAAGTVTASHIVANGTGLLGGANQPGAYDVMAGRVAAGQAVYSYDKICAGNTSGDCNGSGGVVLSSAGNVNAGGTVTAGGALIASQADVSGSGFLRPGWAVETWGCASAGDIAKAAYTIAAGWAWNGQTLTCRAGVWSAASSGGGYGRWMQTWSMPGVWSYQNNPKTGGQSCPAGFTAIGGLMGMAWQWSQWDTSIYWWNCV